MAELDIPTVRMLNPVLGIPANWPDIEYRRREGEYNRAYAHRLAAQYLCADGMAEPPDDLHSVACFVEDILNELAGEWVDP